MGRRARRSERDGRADDFDADLAFEAEQVVRLKFTFSDADLYAYRFCAAHAE